MFDKLREELNRESLKYTYKYHKIRGFKINTGEGTAHNNDADAFKHAFMQAYLMIVHPNHPAKTIGDYHEYIEGWNYDRKENNMDLWNNSIGREIVHDLKCILGRNYSKYSKGELLDIVSEQICDRMENGDLITDPHKDKRLFKHMEYDRLKDSDRVFYNGELYDGMDEEERERFADYYFKYKNRMQSEMPSKSQLDANVSLGDMIYVKNYVRGDGVRVHGYYRKRPNY
jgi:hypothetical protein